ncbi:DUF3037 domain-containing protein [Joostella sp. CR20]|uniref:DUF3037 domain-containing protein n=1 Tax=Joostella sp. CR20 TaxID=2804312 RepID=UPI00313B45FC
MQDRITFEYAIIRFVPKVEREEFFNIGVILFSKEKKFLGVKYHIDKDKLQAFTKEISIDFIETYLQSWTHICKGDAKGGVIGSFEIADRFRWLASTRSTMIQSSKTHPGKCSDPEATLQTIFEKYVL